MKAEILVKWKMILRVCGKFTVHSSLAAELLYYWMLWLKNDTFLSSLQIMVASEWKHRVGCLVKPLKGDTWFYPCVSLLSAQWNVNEISVVASADILQLEVTLRNQEQTDNRTLGPCDYGATITAVDVHLCSYFM